MLGQQQGGEFFPMLKNERVYRIVYATKAQARTDIIRYIEGSITVDEGTQRSGADGLTK